MLAWFMQKLSKNFFAILKMKMIDALLPFRVGTLRDIRLNTNELSKKMGWVIYISKTVISNKKLLFSYFFQKFKVINMISQF